MKSTWPMPVPPVRDPTPPIFHLLALGVDIGGNTNFSVFRYQHVGIPNAKLWHWGSKPMRGPNANGFASQWNIGLRDIQVSVNQLETTVVGLPEGTTTMVVLWCILYMYFLYYYIT